MAVNTCNNNILKRCSGTLSDATALLNQCISAFWLGRQPTSPSAVIRKILIPMVDDKFPFLYKS